MKKKNYSWTVHVHTGTDVPDIFRMLPGTVRSKERTAQNDTAPHPRAKGTAQHGAAPRC